MVNNILIKTIVILNGIYVRFLALQIINNVGAKLKVPFEILLHLRKMKLEFPARSIIHCEWELLQNE